MFVTFIFFIYLEVDASESLLILFYSDVGLFVCTFVCFFYVDVPPRTRDHVFLPPPVHQYRQFPNHTVKSKLEIKKYMSSRESTSLPRNLPKYPRREQNESYSLLGHPAFNDGKSIENHHRTYLLGNHSFKNLRTSLV